MACRMADDDSFSYSFILCIKRRLAYDLPEEKLSIFERFFQLFVTYQLKKQFYRIHLHIEGLPKDKKIFINC